MSSGRNRFYKDVSVAANEHGHGIFLDGRPIRTPMGTAFAVPSKPLADAIAEEWRAQGEKIRPETMLLTKLVNTAIDRVTGNRVLAIGQVLAFAKSDLLCYRAEAPAELIRRQKAAWDPLLEWLRQSHGAALTTGSGMAYVEQPEPALRALERAIEAHNDFVVAGLHTAAALTGSIVLALAMAEGRLTGEEAFDLSHIDETFQAEKWGRDSEAERRAKGIASELIDISRLFSFLRTT
jgi:chaperone required for assembly of F1-ATPase